MRRLNSSVKVDFISEKGVDSVGRTYFAYVPLENMVCYAVAESYDNDNDINSAKLAVESVLVAFELNPSFRNIKQYIQYAHDQMIANSVKNKLEAAVMVVVSDYTRIQYASCGNVKFYLLNNEMFYLKSATQTYEQSAAHEYRSDQTPSSENKNLLEYLGKDDNPKPYVSIKINLPEGSTMLFATCNLWERVGDVEILDAYEESESDKFLNDIQELYLSTQLKNPAIRSYTLASLLVEKPFKEDTAKQNKRRRMMILFTVIVLIVAIIMTIIILSVRASDRRAMGKIDGLDSEAIEHVNDWSYTTLYKQYDEAKELTEKLKNNVHYKQKKKDLTDRIKKRWHLFGNIMDGDKDFENGYYDAAQSAYQEAEKLSENDTDLDMSEVLTAKLKQVTLCEYIESRIMHGKMCDKKGRYVEAIEAYSDADLKAQALDDFSKQTKYQIEVLTCIMETRENQQNKEDKKQAEADGKQDKKDELTLKMAELLKELGNTAKDDEDYKKANEYFTAARNLYLEFKMAVEYLEMQIEIDDIKKLETQKEKPKESEEKKDEEKQAVPDAA